MRILRYLAIVLLLAGLWRPVLAMEPTTAPSASADPMEKVLPEVKFDAISLIDALNFLQDVSPGFSVVWKPGDGAVESTQLTMHMKNVTVRQVLEAMQFEFPAMTICPLGKSGSDASIWIFGQPATSKQEPATLQVFRLGPAIEAMAATNGGQTKTKPLDDILSLIQAALSQVPSPTPPTVQVHEATQTLIFKGNRDQLEAVQQAMAAVGPSPVQEAQDEQEVLSRAREELARLRMQLVKGRQRDRDVPTTRSTDGTNAQP